MKPTITIENGWITVTWDNMTFMHVTERSYAMMCRCMFGKLTERWKEPHVPGIQRELLRLRLRYQTRYY